MESEGRPEERTPSGKDRRTSARSPAEEPEAPSAPEPKQERSHRVVDEGTDQELVILDYSVEIEEHARVRVAPPAPAPSPPEPAAPDAEEPAPDAEETQRSDAEQTQRSDAEETERSDAEQRGSDRRSGDGSEPHEPERRSSDDRRARIGSILDRDWDRELAHRDTPPKAPAKAPSPDPSPVRPVRHVPANGLTESFPRGTDGLAIGSTLLFVAATVLMGFRIEPFATWYYLFAWYPFLLLVNHATATRSPQHSLLSGRLGRWIAVAAWSVPVWMTFELWNLRLQNWYYVGVPDHAAMRWPGVVLSFATVLPGIFLLQEALRVHGLATRLTTPEFAITPVLGRGLRLLGLAWAVLILALPTIFFPLVWGVPVLLIEPWLSRNDDASLLRRLSSGRAGLIARLLVAGAICGLYWEAANFFALGKWIYTVPGFEKLRLFEMPLLGFIGFPPFALCCWSMARALVVLGLLPDWRVVPDGLAPPERRPVRPRVRGGAIAGAAVFTVLMLAATDRWTVDSTTPRPEDIPGIPDGVAEYAARQGHDSVRGVLQLVQEGKLYVPGESSAREIALLRGRCQLVLLRGIGTANTRRLDRAGVRTVDELAAADPEQLTRQLADVESGWSPRPRRVATWVAAARDARPPANPD